MRAYRVVDVFTATPFLGNPVAVVLDGEGLTPAQMQRIAAWTNLSETTFALAPTTAEADYRLRIFTPASELPFAGHPTLGSAHALIEAGIATPKAGRLVQECAAGLIPLSVEGEGAGRVLRLSMPQAKIRDLAAEEGARLAEVLGAAPLPGAAVVDVGPVWITAEMESADAVRALTPDFAAMAAFETGLGATGVTVFGREATGEGIEARSFAPSQGLTEDPVCGSGNGAVGIWRAHAGRVGAESAWIATQGGALGRAGRVEMQVSGGTVFVGGAAVTTVTGEIAL